jgi:hypothetical protein
MNRLLRPWIRPSFDEGTCPERSEGGQAHSATYCSIVRLGLKLPAASCSPPSADSKCKEVITFYCSSLANPVRLRRTTGNALAVAFSSCCGCQVGRPYPWSQQVIHEISGLSMSSSYPDSQPQSSLRHARLPPRR